MRKDPDSVLDFGLDWAQWLGGDTIVTSTWTVDAGVTKTADTHDATTTTVWLSAGTDGQTYRCVNRITTTAGRTDERALRVDVIAR